MVDIIKGATQKPTSSDALIKFFEDNSHLEGQMYIGYPIFSTPDGKLPIDAILIMPNKGILVINLVEGRTLPLDYKDQQDDIYNKLESKLRNYKMLVTKRNLGVNITPITFAPKISKLDNIDEYIVCNPSTLLDTIDKIPTSETTLYKETISALQSISTLRNGTKKRMVNKNDSRGKKLLELEASIANLDTQQGKAVIETVDDVQRIRGLAGSGKTIVLALKAAYLHALNPEWKIAVTFNTRSLKDQFKRLIMGFSIEQTGEEPNWDNLKIIHAWGSGEGEREGIYYDFCISNQISPMDFTEARLRCKTESEFNFVCNEALKDCSTFIPLFDSILIDEAQDFPIEFFRICYHMLKDKKRLVYAYDELQSLTSESLPPPEDLFGKNEYGASLVSFNKPSQDIILEKCYRNSKPILTTAHALGFGIYRKPDKKTGTGLIQIFENSNLWKDVGYSVQEGELEDDECVTLVRTDNTSPEFLEKHSSLDDLISFKSFNSHEEQNNWLIEQIKINLNEDELRHDDIIVINTNPISTRKFTGPIRALLFKEKINSHLVGVDTTPDHFFETRKDSIPFTGIFRAKGNEAGMVYIINTQDCYSSKFQLATIRNRLFTAITRSKAWVRVLGVGDDMDNLIEEFDAIKKNNFKLSFKYPSANLREKLNIVNRDMSRQEQEKIVKANKSIEYFLKDIDNRRLNIEDIDEEKLEELRKILLRKKGS